MHMHMQYNIAKKTRPSILKHIANMQRKLLKMPLNPVKKFAIHSKTIVFALICSALFFLNQHVFAEQSNSLDARLIGEWDGDRETSANCQFEAWKTTRTKDGSVVISFFNDKKKTVSKSQLVGVWWTEDDKLYLLFPGVIKEPDIYTYAVLGEDSEKIKFEINAKSSKGECEGDYAFTDIKTVPISPIEGSRNWIIENIINKLPFSVSYQKMANEFDLEGLTKRNSTKYIEKVTARLNCSVASLAKIEAAIRRRGQRIRAAEIQAFENYRNKARQILFYAPIDSLHINQNVDFLTQRILSNYQQLVSEYLTDKAKNEKGASEQLGAELDEAEESCKKK